MKLKNKSRKHSIKRKIFFCFTMFFIGIIISFNNLEKSENISISEKYNEYLLEEIMSNKTFQERIKQLTEETESIPNSSPLIYLYNTHDTEKYASNNLFQFSPNVTMIKYILKEVFENNNKKTLVEERSIKAILNKNNWNYANSYLASRIYIDEVKNNYPSINYFIDIHRDSLKKDKTTITIGDKSYAKLLFIVGLENANYEKNLEFTKKINNKLNEKYPTLSKGILEKQGPGVNGIYNQDISPNSILVEFGGYENTTYEVLNSTLAFAECYLEVLNEN